MEITSIFPPVVHTPAITGICGSLIVHGQCTLCLKNFYYHSFQLYVVENYTAGHNHGISCSPEIGCTLPPKIHEPTAQCEHVSHQQRSAEPNRRKQLLLELHCAGWCENWITPPNCSASFHCLPLSSHFLSLSLSQGSSLSPPSSHLLLPSSLPCLLPFSPSSFLPSSLHYSSLNLPK